MNRTSRFAAFIGVLLFAAVVGVVAYNAGMARGVGEGSTTVISAPTGAYPYPYYPAYRPWGFGLFVPFFAFIFLVFLIRGMVGRGWYRRGGCGRFEEWHREMHERMKEGESTPR